MKQPNGCSTPAPKYNAAKQWIQEELAQTKEATYVNYSLKIGRQQDPRIICAKVS